MPKCEWNVVSSCAAMEPHPEKGEGIRWFLLTSPIPPKSFMWEPSQATLDMDFSVLSQWDQLVAYCPTHPPELIILSKVLLLIFFYILIVQFCLLPLTTSHLLVTSQPLHSTLFKINSHNFISTFIRFWRGGKTKNQKKKKLSTLPL